jgi:hypothetical protein
MVPRIKNKNIKLGQIGISRRGKKSAKNNHCAAPDPSFSLGLSSFSIPFGKEKELGIPRGRGNKVGRPTPLVPSTTSTSSSSHGGRNNKQNEKANDRK